MTVARSREEWVDTIKGLACVLVALGHGFQGLVFVGILDATALWRWFNGAIYCFHVQLFFLCSGFLWQRFGRGADWRSHWRAVLEKAWVLSVPYVTFTIVQWALKTVCSAWVNHSAGNLWRNLLVEPVAPYWFLATLAILFALFPRVRRRRMWTWLFAATVALKVVAVMSDSSTWFFAARTVSQHAFWFVGGMGVALWGQDWLGSPVAKMAGVVCFTLLLAGSAVAEWRGGLRNPWIAWGVGIVACMAILSWATNRRGEGKTDFWKWAGRNSLPIFLMHTICAAAVRMGLCAIGMVSPRLHVSAMLVASLFGPMLLLHGLEAIHLDGILDPRCWSGGAFGKSRER